MTWPFENDTSAITKKIAKNDIDKNRVKKVFSLTTIVFATALLMMLIMFESGYGTMRKLCIGDRELDTYSDIGNYFRADIDKRLDKCRDFLFVIYISISIVYCILHCGGSDYFDDYYFRFLQFTKNSVG